MEKKGMPVSPHVMIYAFPVVALSSITVRITGVALWGGMAGKKTNHDHNHNNCRYKWHYKWHYNCHYNCHYKCHYKCH